MNTQESTTETNETTPTATRTHETCEEQTEETPYGCHAVLAHKDTGEVRVVFEKKPSPFCKLLQTYGTKWAVLGAFRGKQLNVEQKVSFTLN